jgi:Zn-dependent protease with chaperone function
MLVISALLVIGLFARNQQARNFQVEIDEESQPTFFAFLRRLTNEIGAPMPHRVLVTPDVDAAMHRELSIVNLLIPPKKNLIIGGGLINALNLSEFKAVMAHEFGHFSQKTTRVDAYAYIAMQVIERAVAGPAWFGAWLAAARRDARRFGESDTTIADWIGFFLIPPLWCVNHLLAAIHYVLMFSSLSLSRKQEFHADRVAVSVAGSNAMVHCLYRSAFAFESFQRAINELDTASQHKLYSRDLYLLQNTSAERIRKERKRPDLGIPPELDGPDDGEDLRLFDPDEEHPVPEMWRTHPKNFDREQNAKEIFVPAVVDERSAWVLFEDVEHLKERLTYKFYRAVFRLKKNAKLSPAEKVQEFVDEDYAEMTYDPKYHGAYDERPIWPGDITELNAEIDRDPWAPSRLAHLHDRLYRELGTKVEDFAEVRKAIRKIYRNSYGCPRGRELRRLEDLEYDLEKTVEWFSSFDRRVYLMHAQMARRIDRKLFGEMVHRYRFHLEVQEIHVAIARAQDQVLDVLEGLDQGDVGLPPDFFEEVRRRMKDARNVLEESLRRAEAMRTPEMANIPAGSRFDRLIFDQEVLREVGVNSIHGTWINKLLKQLALMRHRVNRMDFKSLGAILRMHDRVAVDWHAKVAAEAANPGVLPEAIVLEDEPKPATPSGEDHWRE